MSEWEGGKEQQLTPALAKRTRAVYHAGMAQEPRKSSSGICLQGNFQPEERETWSSSARVGNRQSKQRQENQKGRRDRKRGEEQPQAGLRLTRLARDLPRGQGQVCPGRRRHQRPWLPSCWSFCLPLRRPESQCSPQTGLFHQEETQPGRTRGRNTHEIAASHIVVGS